MAKPVEGENKLAQYCMGLSDVSNLTSYSIYLNISKFEIFTLFLAFLSKDSRFRFSCVKFMLEQFVRGKTRPTNIFQYKEFGKLKKHTFFSIKNKAEGCLQGIQSSSTLFHRADHPSPDPQFHVFHVLIN